MRKYASRYIIFALNLVLIGYTAMRTVHLVQMTLAPDSQIAAYFALAALDIGLVFWCEAFLHGSESFEQKAISAIIAVINFLGIGAATIADTFLQSGENGFVKKPSQDALTDVILAISIIILVNVGGGFLFNAMSPELLEKMATDKIRAKVKQRALAKVERDSEVLSQQLAVDISSSLLAQVRAEVLSSLPPGYTLVQGIPSMPANQTVIQPTIQQPPVAQPAQQPSLPKPRLFNFKVNLNGADNSAADSGTPPTSPIDPN